VSGDRATANIVTRTNLVASTTDTTVNCMIAEDPSAPYIVATVRGPLASPSYGVSRGSARDPPGVVNTLTNTVPSIIPASAAAAAVARVAAARATSSARRCPTSTSPTSSDAECSID
jgi:hypothetical protein